jgi:phosphoglucomutase
VGRQRSFGHDGVGDPTGERNESEIAREIHKAKAGKAGLACACGITGTTCLEILARHVEAVAQSCEGFEPCPRFGPQALMEQNAVRGVSAAPDTSAQLMELQQAQTVGFFNHHDGRRWNIDTNFDDGGSDEDACPTLVE